jgi:hypothetical protein
VAFVRAGTEVVVPSVVDGIVCTNSSGGMGVPAGGFLSEPQ